ncbi:MULTISPECIES: hypothetical protein [unclassified Moorena]|nr:MULTISPECIES: hypothetical protein [unclassified Moorena]
MRYTKLFTSFLFRLYCSLLRSRSVAYGLSTCSLKANKMHLNS